AREKLGVVAAVERVGGMQAQIAKPPFVGLWSRLESLPRDAVAREIHGRTLVRATWVRATIHLVSRRDYLAYRTTVQPALDRAVAGILKGRVAPGELGPVIEAVRAFLAKGPATFDAIRDELGRAFPKGDIRAFAYAVRCTVPLVLVPDPSAAFAYAGNAGFLPAETWLDEPPSRNAALADFVRRYLAAYGPASVKDAEAWSLLGKLGDTFESLRGELVTFRDDKGRELFDLADAPRPGTDADAPVRFLPEFDSVLLAHHDRRRIIEESHRPLLATKNLFVPATILVDGMIRGKWTLARKKDAATLEIAPFAKLDKRTIAALEDEGEALARFQEPDAKRIEVRFAKAP
ncbi:MAG TPA: winged helix DNA-binding domain-containing protein, partial [Polyangiaceae bacterium]|nr:winged helix DNA-binding domain-containing protein [Polyangiaceae bacterium]